MLGILVEPMYPPLYIILHIIYDIYIRIECLWLQQLYYLQSFSLQYVYVYCTIFLGVSIISVIVIRCTLLCKIKTQKTSLANLLISLHVLYFVHGFSYCLLQSIFCYFLEGSTLGGTSVLCSMREVAGCYLLSTVILFRMMVRNSFRCFVVRQLFSIISVLRHF